MSAPLLSFSPPSFLLLLAALLLASPTDLLPPADAANVTVDPEFRNIFEESLVLEFDSPTDLEFSPDAGDPDDGSGFLLVAEKDGKVWVVQNWDGGGSVAFDGGDGGATGDEGDGGGNDDHGGEVLVDLALVGDNGGPGMDLGRCEGDCDADDECGPGLVCYQRDGTDAVPGCKGEGVPDKDYCTAGPAGRRLAAAAQPAITKTLALDIGPRMCINGERGLCGIAFHPSYPNEPYVYLYYTYNKYNDCYNELENGQTSGRGTVNRLSRFVLDPTTKLIDVASEVIFLETPLQPVHNHNGGSVAFGNDGLLYLTIGDGGARTWKNGAGVYYSQALDLLSGKVVRLTADGTIPDSNPYTPASGHVNSVRCGLNEGRSGNATTKCMEIYSSGWRNPWRLAMDYDTIDSVRFYVNDVGRKTWERIVEDRKGANHGYPIQDGPCINSGKADQNCTPNEYTADMVHWYLHDDEDGGCITGGAFVPNNAGWPESFAGSYLYAEYAQSGIFSIVPGGRGCPYPHCDPPVSDYAPTKRTLSAVHKVVSMKFGPYGDGYALYYVTRGYTGNRGIKGLFRIAYTGSSGGGGGSGDGTPDNRSPVAVIDADVTIGFSPLTVRFDGGRSADPDGDVLSFAWDLGGDGVTVDSTSSRASFTYAQPGVYYAALTVMDGRGGRGTTKVRIEVDREPPVPLIESPAEGTSFAVGDELILIGSAFDRGGGGGGGDGAASRLPDSSLAWEVRFRHGNHYHSFLGPTEGNRIELEGLPGPGSFGVATSTVLEVVLTATDADGLSMTTSRILEPRTVELDFDADPAVGLDIIVDGDAYRTPVTVVTWENDAFEIDAPTQTVDGVTYSWASWSDGGCKSHSYVAPSSKPPLIVTNFEVVAVSDAELPGLDLLPQQPGSPEPDKPELESAQPTESPCESTVLGTPAAAQEPSSAEQGGMSTGAKIFLAVFLPVAVAAVGAFILFRPRKGRRRSLDQEETAVAAGIRSKGTADTSEESHL